MEDCTLLLPSSSVTVFPLASHPLVCLQLSLTSHPPPAQPPSSFPSFLQAVSRLLLKMMMATPTSGHVTDRRSWEQPGALAACTCLCLCVRTRAGLHFQEEAEELEAEEEDEEEARQGDETSHSGWGPAAAPATCSSAGVHVREWRWRVGTPHLYWSLCAYTRARKLNV